MLTTNIEIIRKSRVALEKLFREKLDSYIDLFFYEKHVVLDPTDAEMLESAGLIRKSGRRWLANVMVFPFRKKYIVTDFLFSLHKKNNGNFTRGINDVWPMYPYETLLFIDKLGRQKDKLALDIASGSGAISLFLAEHFDKVISADINPKAVAYARFNAVLNNLEGRIENVKSDVFRSLKGYKFDYICWNGPTIALPEVNNPQEMYPIYAYGGFDGAQFTRKLLENVFEYTNHKYKIKWLDGCLGNPNQSVIENYIREKLSHPPIKVTIEFLNKRRGIPLREYEKLYKKYCLGKLDFHQKDRGKAVGNWYKKLRENSLSHVYMSYVSIEPYRSFKVVHKDSTSTTFGPRQLYRFEWHYAPRGLIKSYLLTNKLPRTGRVRGFLVFKLSSASPLSSAES